MEDPFHRVGRRKWVVVDTEGGDGPAHIAQVLRLRKRKTREIKRVRLILPTIYTTKSDEWLLHTRVSTSVNLSRGWMIPKWMVRSR